MPDAVFFFKIKFHAKKEKKTRMVWRIKKLLSAALSFITGRHSGLFRIFNLADLHPR